MIEQQLEHINNGLSAQLKQAQKVVARKKLYFAISVAFTYAWENYKRASEAVESAMKLVDDGCDCGKCKNMVEEILPSLLRAVGDALRPIYCISAACQGYKDAFGEHPEFVRFLGRNSDKDAAERVLEGVMGLPKEVEALFSKIGRERGVSKPPPDIAKAAFGNDFLKACEGVKLKGEV